MKYCIHCGNELNENAIVCVKCGSQIINNNTNHCTIKSDCTNNSTTQKLINITDSYADIKHKVKIGLIIMLIYYVLVCVVLKLVTIFVYNSLLSIICSVLFFVLPLVAMIIIFINLCKFEKKIYFDMQEFSQSQIVRTQSSVSEINKENN